MGGVGWSGHCCWWGGKDDVGLSLVGLIWSSLKERYGRMSGGDADSVG